MAHVPGMTVASSELSPVVNPGPDRFSLHSKKCKEVEEEILSLMNFLILYLQAIPSMEPQK
jgi:hypothetical protein